MLLEQNGTMGMRHVGFGWRVVFGRCCSLVESKIVDRGLLVYNLLLASLFLPLFFYPRRDFRVTRLPLILN